MASGGIGRSAPRPAPGTATDPVTLAEVDEVRVVTLVDNVYDGLLPDQEGVRRGPLTAGVTPAPHFEGGATVTGLRAEHGFAALVTVRRGETTSTLIFDTGLSPDAMVVNAERLAVDLGSVAATVLSHGHFDHAGGLSGLAAALGPGRMPLTVHPLVWTRRRLTMPGGAFPLPTVSRQGLEAEGFEVIERRQPSLLLDGHVLITGEVDRATEFERGMPPAHQAWDGAEWVHDPWVYDDQALVVNVRGRGLVVVTGCGHAGVVNIVRHAMRLTGSPRLSALIGGFHLGGPAFEPIIEPTVAALEQWAPDLLVPGHCTGWRAQHAMAARLPQAWTAGSSGTTYQILAA